ncbi:MAG: 5,10-methenyltetrahydromethanopterin hydrogenase cofactor biosynthesis protein HmdB [Methanobacterium sp.]|nr:5,10-methenyltetrahydromethanopterin hydrogenase cofactor biosynthesis protein HmdB [Methanobacterium sp.]
MIRNILKKAKKNPILDKNDLLQLFKIKYADDFLDLLQTASQVRNSKNNTIKLTSTVHLTNICQITPKCKYCGFAARTSLDGYYDPFFKEDQEILDAVKCVEKSDIPRVSCSGAHGYNGFQAVNAAKIVKENTSLELLVNVGADLNMTTLKELYKYNTDTICCNLETVNKNLFCELKPGEKLKDRIKICRKISNLGIELSSGLLIGLGESYQDRVNHLLFLKKFQNLGEIPIMGFNPYKNTPMEDHPPCPLTEQVKTIAITRLMFPQVRITVPTPTIGPRNIKYSLIAGADNLATVIPEDYPADVKGVGSPSYGNLKDVVGAVHELGLKLES